MAQGTGSSPPAQNDPALHAGRDSREPANPRGSQREGHSPSGDHGTATARTSSGPSPQGLGYSSASLLCLSPTDSIIEAIRCALELEAPVYGVDLRDYARTDRCNVLIQDPIEAQSNLADYVRKNAKFSETCRDQIVDERLGNRNGGPSEDTACPSPQGPVYRRPGSARQRIQTFLQDRTLQPATAVPAGASVPYTRVVVHPALAAHQMDIFPNVTHWYEKRREPVPRENAVRDIVDFNVFFHEHLSAIRKLLSCSGLRASGRSQTRRLSGVGRIRAFPRRALRDSPATRTGPVHGLGSG